MVSFEGFPEKQGLYDPQFEKDSCGVGFVCDIKGRKSCQIVAQGLEILNRLAHRGAVGADPGTGDGAGVLIQTPHKFFTKIAAKHRFVLPGAGEYGTGLVFLPSGLEERLRCKDIFTQEIERAGLYLIGWRQVPVDGSVIGDTARSTMPSIQQVFVGKKEAFSAELDFERRLYLLRKRIENALRQAFPRQKSAFYVTNLSCRTFSYKGLLTPQQVGRFFPELNDPDMESSLCLVHSRYSTNTFPSWDLAQPFRYLAHNGEINTLRGNINWMLAKESLLNSQFFGQDTVDLKPVIVPGGSDSASIDNLFELLVLSGRSLEQAMLMLIPEAWEQDHSLDTRLKSFYEYHACCMEPWDGPAAMAFTDGTRVGALLDRNGLRPARYIVTKRDLMVMASEAGVLDIPGQDIAFCGRLEPGKMLLIDTAQGRIIDNDEIKRELAYQRPFDTWLADNLVELDKLPVGAVDQPTGGSIPSDDLPRLLKTFDYTREDLKMILRPMAQTGFEPLGSMGNDTPHAVLSARPQLLYKYFKQLFAQVTNPPIDSIREELVMSLTSYVGKSKNILEETPEHCHKLKVKNPILTNEGLIKIRDISHNGFKTKTISLLFDVASQTAFKQRLDAICQEALAAIEEGYTFLILSDRGTNVKQAALPAILACGALHHHLVKQGLRSQIGIIIESAEPREVHHFAVLFGYGADCVNPYLAYAAIKYLISEKYLAMELPKAMGNYIHSVEKGLLKILSKMGISTLQSYRGAQIFEAIGLGPEVIDKSFCGTFSRIGGADLGVIAQETILRHQAAYSTSPDAGLGYFAVGGVYQWKKDGEFHLWNPDSIAALQDSVRKDDFKKFKEFSRQIDDQSKNPTTLRSLLKFKPAVPITLAQVEPAKEIVKRFVTGAMSFGSISRGAHESIAMAMNRLSAKSNTGEGGEDPARFIKMPSGDSRRSAIKQVASGRFGVTTNYLINADEIQIKIAQGAKPGEGGQLPGHKVSEIIAKTRYTTPGVTLISPPPHHDIYSIEDLAQLIFDLKNVNPAARISVKLVSEIGVGTVAAGVAKGHADMILISGGDGGTGASPKSSIMYAGLPWELGISEAHQTLVLNDLRARVRLQTDGQMRTGRDVAIAAMLGAEEFGFCTSVLITLGCVMLRHCYLNNCVLGVATQDPELEKRFSGKPEYVMTYINFVVEELREIMASLGCRTVNALVGRTDLLELNRAILGGKSANLDYSRLLYRPQSLHGRPVYCVDKQDHGIDHVLDRALISDCQPALTDAVSVRLQKTIVNENRATGAMLSGEVCKRFGEAGLKEDTIRIKFHGIAGQSFGAWLVNGVTFELEGLANDYVGKGLSGGKIIIYPDAAADYAADENTIIGNTAFYGAINGVAYICGRAGERFCIRNSGASVVVEGVGDHACEYMTGGRVVVIGQTGRNFAAGMSGGIAYILDPESRSRERCNLAMVELEALDADDEKTVHCLLADHAKYTGSRKAKKILGKFDSELKKFVKVMPIEYKRILAKEELEPALAEEGE